MIKQLAKIQRELKAPKNQFNKFGGYKYRNCEDILEAVKPLLGDLVLTISDDIVEIGGRVYVCATAKITDGENTIENKAYAREAMSKKGMDESQITGSASSYARKYALNGLFLIDDTKDADSMKPANTRTVLDAFKANHKSILAMRQAFESQDYPHLVQLWDEITGDPEADTDSGQNDKTLLWVAPSKYQQYGLPEPIFSTELRAWLKDNASQYR